MAAGFYIGLFVLGVILFVLYARTGKPVRCMLFTAGTGLPALGILWLVGRWVSVPVVLTPLSVLISAVLGVPGVLAMLILHLI